jgi:hypothetical protein
MPLSLSLSGARAERGPGYAYADGAKDHPHGRLPPPLLSLSAPAFAPPAQLPTVMGPDLGFKGASSHSGRRTFVTRCAKKIIEAGGSLRDVQELAGHASLATTQRYIQGDTDAKRKVVDL